MKSPAKYRWLTFCMALALFAGNVWVWALVLHPSPPHLTVTFLDVGQGDGIVIETPGGHVLVVDTGPIFDNDDMGRRVLLPFLRSKGINRIDAILLTHPHSDHVGGAATLLQRLSVGKVLTPTIQSAEPVFQRVLKIAGDQHVPIVTVRKGENLAFNDGFAADVLNPSEVSASSPNNGSIALRIRFGSTSLVLTGDAEEEAENQMAGLGHIQADVLKLGHHGSRTSTTEAFLNAVHPQAAIVSVGAHNTFGHPSKVVIERLAQHRIPLFRTDVDGAVVVTSDGRKLTMTPTRRDMARGDVSGRSGGKR